MLRGETDKRGNWETRDKGAWGLKRGGQWNAPPHSEGAGSKQREEEADRWGARV